MAKKGDGIRIIYNKKLLWIIIVLIILFVILIYFIAKNNGNNKDNTENNNIVKECSIDNDCSPATCCHSDSCIPVINKPNCKGMFCSMDCSGPLDCGAGHCGCINGKCSVVSNSIK